MKTKNTIHIFFVALALAFWNPLTFYLIYRQTPVVAIKSVALFFTAVFLLGLLAIYFLRRDRMGARLGNLTFSLAFLGIFLALLIFIDSLLPLALPSKQGLVFEPMTQVRLKTVEFDCTATINSMGLRDREFPVEKGENYRILCFGDSWTFGWGVDIGDSWPARLETYLKANGQPTAQVINCGQAGNHTGVYKKHMWRAVPALKPDLVLVGVLQGDDLAQLSEDRAAQKAPSGGWFLKTCAIALDSGREFFRYAFKNTLKMLGRKNPWEANLAEEWGNAVNTQVPKLAPAHKARFENLPDSVKILFRSGNLNTGLFEQYVDFPARHIDANTPQNPATAWSAAKMARDFAEMSAFCRDNGAKLVFVNLPFNIYVGHRVVRNFTDSLDARIEQNNKVDSIYRAVAEGNGLPYVQLTEGFRALPDKSAYFYRFDGHPNAKGHDEMAHQVGQQLLKMPIWK